MAILKVLKYGDKILRKKSKPVSKISKKIHILIDNMLETLYAYNGVGLAAPQVGENLCIFVIDTAVEPKDRNPIIFINPKIIKKSGATNSHEGCLSFPEAYTDVRRYKNVTVKATDIHGKPFVMEGKDGELLASAMQHEYDHLEGKLFVDHARNRFVTDEVLLKYNLNPIELDYLLEEPELEEEIANEEQSEQQQQN